jgi:hypothetical protein
MAGISMAAQCSCDARLPTVRLTVCLVPNAVSISSFARILPHTQHIDAALLESMMNIVLGHGAGKAEFPASDVLAFRTNLLLTQPHITTTHHPTYDFSNLLRTSEIFSRTRVTFGFSPAVVQTHCRNDTMMTDAGHPFAQRANEHFDKRQLTCQKPIIFFSS